MRTTFFRYAAFILLFGLLIHTNSIAQEQDISNYRMRFNFKTIKQHDNSRILEASFIAANKKDRKDRIPVYDANIKFFNSLVDKVVLLGVSKTSKEGIARITLPKDQNYLLDDDGNIHLKAIFEGTGELDEEEEEISIKNLNLELDLTEIDSIKTVLVKAYSMDSLGVEIPVEELDIIIAVDGMLSKMNINEGAIENGEYEFEIPTDLPGDVDGNITIYSIVEDHDEFGDVINKKTINWGVFSNEVESETNLLWSEVAPIWMYAVLTVLLVGVWSNYIYTIINLRAINKEGKELELNAENQQ